MCLLLYWFGPAAAARNAAPLETGTIVLTPKDTFLNTNTKNYSTSTTLPTYTWPDYKRANSILMKFDFSKLPAGAIVTEATLHLALVAADTASDPTYIVTAHKMLGRNPNITKATGYNADGQVPWTPNNCCASSAPLAQADISLPYDTRAVDKVKGFKAWTITPMVQEWLLNPASNLGLLLNADATKRRDRHRTFASMEYADVKLRPYLKITFLAADVTPPSVALTAPAGGDVSGVVAVTANASDNVGVAGVQFRLDGMPLGSEHTGHPYSLSWDTSTRSDGAYSLTAVARDTAGNTTTSAPVSVAVKNGILVLVPQDTSLNINANNYSADTMLTAYTWPDYQMANAILMKFDLSAVPAGAVVEDATLFMALVQSDTLGTHPYTISASKVLMHDPVISRATGYTADGVTSWTPSNCCSNSVPLAQSDISGAYATLAVDKIPGFKSWGLTTMLQEWLSDPATNFGVLLGSDATQLRDHHRFFASSEHPDAALRPFLRVAYSVSDDATPPNISGTAAAGVTENSAAINWITDEVSDSQVEYGNTSAYGTVTTLDRAMVTGHAVMLTGLSTGRQYHFRVRSRDQAGNLATSGNFTFTTPDTTQPAVSITAPADGAPVSGTVTVTAAATDNVGVAGVQFMIDGANLGAEDTTAPYSASWNSSGSADGSHTVTAVARDAAGNITNSAAVVVIVANAPPAPPSGGIASQFPGDVGIENHSGVVFVERFDQDALSTLFGRWSDVLNGSSMSFSTDAPAGSPVARSLTIPWTGGGVSSGGHLYKQLSDGVSDTLFVRYYVKYPSTGRPQHEGVWMGGNNPPLPYPMPQAGIKPAGNDRFSAAAELTDDGSRLDHYDYWMGMRPAADGKHWGNTLLNNPNVTPAPGQWMCVEHMVKLNNPVTALNGEHAIWVNGVKVSHVGQGFPNGSWSGGNFTQHAGGAPFEGLRWRSDAALNINWIWLQNYAPNDPGGLSSSIKYAHLVAAKSYVGCLTPGSSEPPPPPPSGGTAVFSSNWDTAVGNSNAAITDGGRWPNYWEFNGGTSTQLLSVVPDGVNGHNALRVQQRGSSFAANLQIDNLLPPSQDFYMRYYMKNNDTSNAGDHIVTADTYNYANLTYMRKTGGPSSWNFVISLYGCGYTYPIGHWGPARSLNNGQWYRFEYFVDYVDATHVRVHPRVYDANGVMIMSDGDFRQSDFGGSLWNGKSDWTLASYYAAGHSFCVNPGWMNDFGLGNNGQYGAADTGQYWFFAGFEVRTDRWPGAVQ